MRNSRNQQQASPTGKSVELADILHRYGKSYRQRHAMTSNQHRIMNDIIDCRTLALGGHASKCDHCAHIEISYNSCRNRHCPKCQALNKARWLDDRTADLLPVPYIHGVFTLPHELNALIMYNKRVLLSGLFKVVNNTLKAFARNDRRGLQGELGYTAVLHTWNQKLLPHFHLHCIIPSGVYRADEKRWVSTRYRFLFPVKALSKVFRGKMVSFCRKAYQAESLDFPDSISHLRNPHAFSALLSDILAKEWVVYAKQPFKSPRFVLDYLGRYTHRVAIGNHRIRSMDDGIIRFAYKDRKSGYQNRVCQLPVDRFIRRFLCHELPTGFMRIRHFGFLGNAKKHRCLNEIRSLLGEAPQSKRSSRKSTNQLMLEKAGIDITRCPKCAVGRLKRIDEFSGIFNNPAILTMNRKAG